MGSKDEGPERVRFVVRERDPEGYEALVVVSADGDAIAEKERALDADGFFRMPISDLPSSGPGSCGSDPAQWPAFLVVLFDPALQGGTLAGLYGVRAVRGSTAEMVRVLRCHTLSLVSQRALCGTLGVRVVGSRAVWRDLPRWLEESERAQMVSRMVKGAEEESVQRREERERAEAEEEARKREEVRGVR